MADRLITSSLVRYVRHGVRHVVRIETRANTGLCGMCGITRTRAHESQTASVATIECSVTHAHVNTCRTCRTYRTTPATARISAVRHVFSYTAQPAHRKIEGVSQMEEPKKKVCTKCREEKPVEEFFVREASKDGLSSRCKSCAAQYDRRYREENKEKVNARRSRYYEENKEKIAARGRRYREENKEKVAARKSRYYEENKEKIAARGRQYRKENKEKIAAEKRRYCEENKEKVAAKGRRYREENKEKLTSNRRRYCEENKEKIASWYRQYYEENKEQIIARWRRRTAAISDSYVRSLLRAPSDIPIPQSLIEAKRFHLRILRELRKD